MSEQPHIHLRLHRVPPTRRRAMHEISCRCHVCDPYLAHRNEQANIGALRIVLGLGLGGIASTILAWAFGLPGFLTIFGLGG